MHTSPKTEYDSTDHLKVRAFEDRMHHLNKARTHLIDPTSAVNMVSSYLSPMPLKVGKKFRTLKQKDSIHEAPIQMYKPGNARDQYMERWC